MLLFSQKSMLELSHLFVFFQYVQVVFYILKLVECVNAILVAMSVNVSSKSVYLPSPRPLFLLARGDLDIKGLI